MKRTLAVVILEISIFFGLMVSLHAREKKEDESLLFLMAACTAAKAAWTKKTIRRYENYLKIKPDDHIVGLEYADFLQDNGGYRKAEPITIFTLRYIFKRHFKPIAAVFCN